MSWGASGSGSGSVVAMGTASVTGAAASAGASRARTGGAVAAAGAGRRDNERRRLGDEQREGYPPTAHLRRLDGVEADGGLATRFSGRSTDQSMYMRLVLMP